MSDSRPAVLALSTSEQQRETLVIMLEESFDVTAASSPLLRPLWPEPDAVVIASETGDEDIADVARRRWPYAGMVLIDAPQPVRGAALASWADPYSVPAAVAQVARTAEPLDDDILRRALLHAEIALRPPLEQGQSLAALAVAAARPASLGIAAQLLGEHLGNLVDRFAWVDWFDESESAGETISDLGAALRAALEERSDRAARRNLDVQADFTAPVAMSSSPLRAQALARCLRGIVLGLAPGAVRLQTGKDGLTCEHHALEPAMREQFEVAIAAQLVRRAGGRLNLGEGFLAIHVEHAADHA